MLSAEIIMNMHATIVTLRFPSDAVPAKIAGF
jgi:hypothetical protein